MESKHYLKWNPAGVEEGDLVFVSGHPGSTERLKTVAQLEAERDHVSPDDDPDAESRRLDTLKRYGARGPEPARQAANQVFSIENALKAFKGEHDGLLNPGLMKKKMKEEAEFRALVSKNRELESRYGSVWEELGLAQKRKTWNVPRRRSSGLCAARAFPPWRLRLFFMATKFRNRTAKDSTDFTSHSSNRSGSVSSLRRRSIPNWKSNFWRIAFRNHLNNSVPMTLSSKPPCRAAPRSKWRKS